MRTTRRPHFALAPLLRSFGTHHYCELHSMVRLPVLGRRADAIFRASAAWCRPDFVADAPDADFVSAVRSFHDAVVSTPLFGDSISNHADRARRGILHILESRDSLALRLHRTLSGVAFAIPTLGPAFWSAVAQTQDPLRHPSWTAATVLGAQKLGLVQRRRIWYGDLLSACEHIRDRDPRMTALHVDHFLTLVARADGTDLAGVQPDDLLPQLIAEERVTRPIELRLCEHSARIASARRALVAALEAEDGHGAIAALESLDARLSVSARAWDPAALLKWIAWIWNDEDPLAEVAACEREAAGAGRYLTSAILHLRYPDQFPLWDRSAAAGLARIVDGTADTYRFYAEAITAICERYRLHFVEAPAVLARLTRPE